MCPPVHGSIAPPPFEEVKARVSGPDRVSANDEKQGPGAGLSLSLNGTTERHLGATAPADEILTGPWARMRFVFRRRSSKNVGLGELCAVVTPCVGWADARRTAPVSKAERLEESLGVRCARFHDAEPGAQALGHGFTGVGPRAPGRCDTFDVAEPRARARCDG